MAALLDTWLEGDKDCTRVTRTHAVTIADTSLEVQPSRTPDQPGTWRSPVTVTWEADAGGLQV